jgi:integrase
MSTYLTHNSPVAQPDGPDTPGEPHVAEVLEANPGPDASLGEEPVVASPAATAPVTGPLAPAAASAPPVGQPATAQPHLPDPVLLGAQAAVLEALTARADAHEQAARSPRTRALYAGDWAHFSRWCELAGRPACPANAETLRWYLTDLEAARTETGAVAYQPATLARRLAAIAAAHRDAGHASPTRDPRVRAVLSGISRTRRHAPRRMRPLLLEDLRSLLSAMDYSSWPAGVAATRDAFVLLSGFAGALRRSELAALTVGDLTWHRGDGLYARIRASKTDQDGAGATVVLPFGAHPGTCPPCAYLRWARLLAASGHGRRALMTAVFATPTWDAWTHLCAADDSTRRRGGAPARDLNDDRAADTAQPASQPATQSERPPELPAEMPVLRAISKGGTLTTTAITGDGLHVMVKRRAAATGIGGPIGFHSLRAGFVTQARRNGADTRAVRRQTRHSADAMVEVYDRDYAPLLGNAVSTLGL